VVWAAAARHHVRHAVVTLLPKPAPPAKTGGANDVITSCSPQKPDDRQTNKKIASEIENYSRCMVSSRQKRKLSKRSSGWEGADKAKGSEDDREKTDADKESRRAEKTRRCSQGKDR
jgi:hypothetical protein